MIYFLYGIYCLSTSILLFSADAETTDSVLMHRQLQEVEMNQNLVLSIRNLGLHEQQIQLEVRLAQLQLQHAQIQSQLRAIQALDQEPLNMDALMTFVASLKLVAVIEIGERKLARFRNEHGFLTVENHAEIASGVRVTINQSWVELRDQHSFYRFTLE